MLPCGIGGQVLGESLFTEDQSKLDEARKEAERYRELNRNIPLANDQSLHYSAPDNLDTRCGNEVVPICSDSDGAYSGCEKEAEFFYLDPKLALKVIGFYSPKGCFKGPYMKDKRLKSHFQKELRNLKKQEKIYNLKNKGKTP
jgi:hypothetical protein